MQLDTAKLLANLVKLPQRVVIARIPHTLAPHPPRGPGNGAIDHKIERHMGHDRWNQAAGNEAQPSKRNPSRKRQERNKRQVKRSGYARPNKKSRLVCRVRRGSGHKGNQPAMFSGLAQDPPPINQFLGGTNETGQPHKRLNLRRRPQGQIQAEALGHAKGNAKRNPRDGQPSHAPGPSSQPKRHSRMFDTKSSPNNGPRRHPQAPHANKHAWNPPVGEKGEQNQPAGSACNSGDTPVGWLVRNRG